MSLENYDDYSQYVTFSLIATATKTAIDVELFINQARLSGLTDEAIEALLIADLAEGGFIFGSFASSLTLNIKDSVNILGKAGSMNTFINAGVTQYKWVVANGPKACPDCKPRDGRIETMETWTDIGQPASGWSVCRSHCGCKLVPVQYTGKTSFDKKKK